MTKHIESKYYSVYGERKKINGNIKTLSFAKIFIMASNPDFVQYIADQCEGAGEIMVKKMFGDYGIYCDGVIFGLICDNCFYLKPTEAGRAMLRIVDMRPPYDGAKDYFFIEDIDDRDYMSELVKTTCKELQLQKSNNKRRSQRNHPRPGEQM